MYKGKVQFYLIYINEAHPSDGWQVPQNEKDGVVIENPENIEERNEVASSCVVNLKLSMPTLIDNMENTTNKDYCAWPDRIFIVGKDGKISYTGGRGPFGFKSDELFKQLDKMFPEVLDSIEKQESKEE